MPTERELQEMAQDYEQMDIDGQAAKVELRLLQEGRTIVVPKDVEHAQAMFKMACFYLSQYDENFNLKME